MNTLLVWSILLILVGIYISAVGLRHVYNIYIKMTWLHIQVTHHPDCEKVSYNFSNGFMHLCSYGPIIGLTLILVGIKYLPV